jgi:hypothetical protein
MNGTITVTVKAITFKDFFIFSPCLLLAFDGLMSSPYTFGKAVYVAPFLVKFLHGKLS